MTKFLIFLVVDNFAISLSDVDGSDNDGDEEEDYPSMSALGKEKNIEK